MRTIVSVSGVTALMVSTGAAGGRRTHTVGGSLQVVGGHTQWEQSAGGRRTHTVGGSLQENTPWIHPADYKVLSFINLIRRNCSS